jgi:hypothetical protein
MGASFAAGTQPGAGAAYDQKGPGNKRNQYAPLVSPHVVAAGTATSGGAGALTVNVGTLEAAATNFVVICTPKLAAVGTPFVDLSTDNSDGLMVSFRLNVAGIGTTDWIVVKK